MTFQIRYKRLGTNKKTITQVFEAPDLATAQRAAKNIENTGCVIVSLTTIQK